MPLLALVFVVPFLLLVFVVPFLALVFVVPFLLLVFLISFLLPSHPGLSTLFQCFYPAVVVSSLPLSLPPSSSSEPGREGGREEAMCALWFDDDEDERGNPNVVEVRRKGGREGGHDSA